MEIQMILDHKIANSSKITALQGKLRERKNRCLDKLSNIYSPEIILRNRKICEGDSQIYQRYLEAYKKQFIEKGQSMCLQNIVNEQLSQLKSQQESRRKCVNFYMKGFNVFESNTSDKLQSLVYKLDYSQL